MTTITTSVDGQPSAPPQRPIPPPPRLRRRPVLAALGVALVALGGLGAAYLVTGASDADPVLALRSDVDRGAVIEDSDLVVAHLEADPALAPVPAAQLDSIVGQRAARDLTSGSLLTADSVTDAMVPAEGDSLVGVALTPAQLPGSDLHLGEAVRIVNTPRVQDDLAEGQPQVFDATVVAVHQQPDLGQVVVDLTVPTAQAARLAALAGTGRVALIVDGAS